MSHSVTATSTLTATTDLSNHGTALPVSLPEAMDVDQRPAASNDKGDAMSIAANKSPTQATQQHSSIAPESIAPSPVLERPRQDAAAEGSSSEVQTSPSQKAQPPIQVSHLSNNLLSVFNLDTLVATVARFDPVTGEKINKMRKSYEGQLKQLALSGKNKSIKHQEAIAAPGTGKMMGLCEMAAWPEEEWQNQKVYGKSIQKGLSDSVTSKLEKAFLLHPGHVPDGMKWEDILGIDRPNPNASLNSNSKIRKDSKSNGNPSATTSNTVAAAPGGNEPIRARRNTKKRRYDDGSFEGYGEGFVDDEMDFDGYESGETYTSQNSRGSRGGEKNKRRKTKDFTNSPIGYGAGSSRTPSFGATYGR